MRQDIEELLRRQNTLYHLNKEILIASVSTISEGNSIAKDILYSLVDRRTMLYLSGGSTPKSLYTKLATEEKLIPGGVGMVDERFGEKLHASSNELLIKETGFLRYLEMRGISFYPILENHLREGTDSGKVDASYPKGTSYTVAAQNDELRNIYADKYDKFVRSSHSMYQKSIAVLGIGSDGHTAGIAPSRSDFTNPLFEKEDTYQMVSSFNDVNGNFKERVTFTFLGLSMMDLLIVLVFGDEKREALKKMFDDGKEENIPSRFFTRPDVAKRTIVITDQEI